MTPAPWLSVAQKLMDKAKLLSKKAIREKDKVKRENLINSIECLLNRADKKVGYFYQELHARCLDNKKSWKLEPCYSIGRYTNGCAYDDNTDPEKRKSICPACDRSFSDQELKWGKEGHFYRFPKHKPLRKRS